MNPYRPKAGTGVHRTARLLLALVTAIALTVLISCTAARTDPTTTPADAEPTPDIHATVAAGIAATKEADRSIEATITARVEATKDAEPTSTTEPKPTPTLAPTAKSPQTPTQRSPTDPVSEEMRDKAKRLYDCLQENEAYKRTFRQELIQHGTTEELNEQAAAELADFMLTSREFFASSVATATTQNVSEEELQLTLDICEATKDEQTQTPSETDSASEPISPTGTFVTKPVGHSCDDILRNQFIFQRNASTPASLNAVISNIQNQRGDQCPIDEWNPVVASQNDMEAGGTAGCKAATIGTLDVPLALHQNGAADTNARNLSGRDRDHNIIVHWKHSKRPSDGAKCWLYIERLSTWSAE